MQPPSDPAILRHLRSQAAQVLLIYARDGGIPLVRELLWEAQGQGCIYCDTQMLPHRRHRGHRYRDTLEHVWPRALGGVDWPGNLALACDQCNNRKGERGPTSEQLDRLRQLNEVLGWPTVLTQGDITREASGAE